MSDIDTSTEAVEAMAKFTQSCIDLKDCESVCREAGHCVARRKIIEGLMADTRRAAFEEAAKRFDPHPYTLWSGERAAADIRSLSEKGPQK